MLGGDSVTLGAGGQQPQGPGSSAATVIFSITTPSSSLPWSTAPIDVRVHVNIDTHLIKTGSRICRNCKIRNEDGQGGTCVTSASSLFSPRGAAASPPSSSTTPVTILRPPCPPIVLPTSVLSHAAMLPLGTGHSSLSSSFTSSGQASPAIQQDSGRGPSPSPLLSSGAMHWQHLQDVEAANEHPPRKRRNSLTGEGPVFGASLDDLPQRLLAGYSSNDSVVSACKEPACENG